MTISKIKEMFLLLLPVISTQQNTLCPMINKNTHTDKKEKSEIATEEESSSRADRPGLDAEHEP